MSVSNVQKIMTLEAVPGGTKTPVETPSEALLKPQEVVDERNNKLEKLAKSFNMDIADLKAFILKATGRNISEISDQDFNILTERTLPVLIQNSKSFKKKSIDNSKKLDIVAANFKKSIDNGNTYDEATNFAERFKNNSLFDLLKLENPAQLRGYKTLKEVPAETLKECVKNLIDKSEQLREESGNKGFGKSLAIFKNLLDNSSDEDKAILWNAYKEIASSDEKIQGLKAVIDKTETQKKLQEFLKSFTPQKIQALGLDPKDIAKANFLLSSNLDEEGVKKLQELQFKFSEEIYAKVRELKNKNREEYTEEDKQALAALEDIKQTFAGAAAGYQVNKNLSTDARQEYTGNVLDKSQEIDIYADVLKNIAVLENDTTGIVNFTDEEKAQFESSLNKITKGEYQNTVETYQAELKSAEEQKPTAQDENGQFVTAPPTKIAEAQKRAEKTKAKIAKNSNDNKTPEYTVESNERIRPTLNDALVTTTGFNRFVEQYGIRPVAKLYSRLESWTQMAVVNFLTYGSEKNMLNTLNYCSTASLRADVSAKIGGFTEDMFKKLTAVTITEKTALGMREAEEKNKEEINTKGYTV